MLPTSEVKMCWFREPTPTFKRAGTVPDPKRSGRQRRVGSGSRRTLGHEGPANEWRRGDEGVSTPGFDAANSADGCKRTALTHLDAVVQPGCTTKRHAIKPGLISRRQGLPAKDITVQPGCTKENAVKPGFDIARPRTGSAGERLSTAGPDQKNNCAEPGSAHNKKAAQAGNVAQVSVRDRDVTRAVCWADCGGDAECQDAKRLDAHRYWILVS
ncbi:reverse transcriptase [Phytophthora cinnamomi]|uniref:reverse transcriptase n=1 Tax=Phytophthora cinnamomi TaxID=4785 RepID=UPI0035599BD5|nr:reverse transcriptase [Phytophthora cinnamomi]